MCKGLVDCCAFKNYRKDCKTTSKQKAFFIVAGKKYHLTVDWRKMRSLAIAANAYVQRYQVHTDVRFDIITVVGQDDDVQIEHLENAFIPPLR